MTKKDKLQKVIEQWERKAQSLADESSFARKHNFTIEAQVLYDKKQLLEDICRDIRLKVIEELLQV
jgi:hypothetical protein